MKTPRVQLDVHNTAKTPAQHNILQESIAPTISPYLMRQQDIIALQRTIGNQAVIRHLQRQSPTHRVIQRAINQDYNQWKAGHPTHNGQPDTVKMLSEYVRDIVANQRDTLGNRLVNIKEKLEAADQTIYGNLLAAVKGYIRDLNNGMRAYIDKDKAISLRSRLNIPH